MVCRSIQYRPSNTFHWIWWSTSIDQFVRKENNKKINELTDKKNLLDSTNQLKKLNKLIVITRSDKGSLAIQNNEIINCDSIKVEKVLDLTGAGDLFAAGFLKEYLDKSEIKKCLMSGSILASKIIQRIGARLE